MATPDPVTAVIHFIGIITFTTQLSTDNHLQALLPRIDVSAAHADSMEHTTSTTSLRQRPTRRGDANHVEPHVAFLAFPACNYVASSGWAPTGLETIPGLLYVRLDGERITFVPKSERGSPSLEDEAAEARSSELQLPHLQKNCCTAMKTLNSQFQPPDFPGAAAVFDLQYGRASACLGRGSRVDTNLTMTNYGGITITATNGTTKKSIELAGNATVYVGNLPIDVLDGKPSRLYSAPHFMAYYSMGDGTKECSSFACAQQTELQPCSDPSALRTVGSATIVTANGQGHSLLETARIDFECSNTQWP